MIRTRLRQQRKRIWKRPRTKARKRKQIQQKVKKNNTKKSKKKKDKEKEEKKRTSYSTASSPHENVQDSHDVGRARVAHDLAIATALRMDVDMLGIAERNIRMAETNEWIKDRSCNVAVLKVNKRRKRMENLIRKHGAVSMKFGE